MEQVIFKIDKKLKEQAMKKARREGIPYSAVLKTATQAYIKDQFEVGLVYSPKFIQDLQRVDREPTIRGDLRKLIKSYK